MKAVTQNQGSKKKLFSTKELVTISLLSALAYVLMLVKLPFSYLGFLELEFSDIPAIIGAIAYGPIAGVFIELIKNLIKALTASNTAGIGELANFLISLGYIIPVSILFRKYKFKYKPLVAFASGTIGLMVAGCIINYFITLPLYVNLYGLDLVLAGATKTIPMIKDLGTLVIIGITPFNLVKGIMMSVVGYYTYIVVRKVIKF